MFPTASSSVRRAFLHCNLQKNCGNEGFKRGFLVVPVTCRPTYLLFTTRSWKNYSSQPRIVPETLRLYRHGFPPLSLTNLTPITGNAFFYSILFQVKPSPVLCVAYFTGFMAGKLLLASCVNPLLLFIYSTLLDYARSIHGSQWPILHLSFDPQLSHRDPPPLLRPTTIANPSPLLRPTGLEERPSVAASTHSHGGLWPNLRLRFEPRSPSSSAASLSPPWLRMKGLSHSHRRRKQALPFRFEPAYSTMVTPLHRFAHTVFQ